ncbi:MAG TPA: rod shape-determining protein MreC [Candidatus Sulfotelmatobacter sp.]|jgi:rod shape-determining protein MreC
MDVFGRYRNLIILVGVLFLQVLGLAMQVKRSSTEATQDTRLIRVWAVGVLSPFERALVWIQNGTGTIWHNYFYLRGVRAENRDLKSQIEQMRLDQVRLNEDAAQARRLQALLGFKEQFISKTVAAQVFGSSGSDLSRVIWIDKGKNSGIEPDMPVITANGIVGKVLIASGSESQVLLINDQSSGVGAVLEKSRLQGVLRGTSNGQVVLEKVMADEQVVPGETVLTSGGDWIFPKGLPVGTVMEVSKGKDLFLNIKIKPAASLSRLEEVLVLVEKQERPSLAEEKTRMRAADILAQRLPSVPDKPVADAKSVGVTAKGNANAASVTTSAKPKTEASSAGQPAAKPMVNSAAENSTGAAGTSAPRPKSMSAPASASKPALSEPKPAITEQKATTQPVLQPNPQPQPDDNGPH